MPRPSPTRDTRNADVTCIVDPASGRLTVEGLDPAEWRALAGDLTDTPQAINCGRPAADVASLGTVPTVRVAGSGDTPIRIARIYHGSVVDGPGRRSVVQVQGCPIRCAGCYVPETHDPRGGVELPVSAVAAAALDPGGAPRDGVTVLGGEPFAQPAALAALLRCLKVRGAHTVVYSGYTIEALRRRADAFVRMALALTDLLIDGAFVAALADGAGEWRGSRNQRLLARESLGRIVASSEAVDW